MLDSGIVKAWNERARGGGRTARLPSAAGPIVRRSAAQGEPTKEPKTSVRHCLNCLTTSAVFQGLVSQARSLEYAHTIVFNKHSNPLSITYPFHILIASWFITFIYTCYRHLHFPQYERTYSSVHNRIC